MPYFTIDEARRAARNVVNSSFKVNAKSILESDARTASAYDSFDIFLSHSSKDAELVLGVKAILEKEGITVYVDWHDDPQANRDNVTPKTAELLRIRMKQSKSLVFMATDNASDSKWMPWELGFFDGLSDGAVAILPLVNYDGQAYKGQEYLGLYPVVDKGKYTNGNSDIFVSNKKGWLSLDKFRKGHTNWNSFN